MTSAAPRCGMAAAKYDRLPTLLGSRPNGVADDLQKKGRRRAPAPLELAEAEVAPSRVGAASGGQPEGFGFCVKNTFIEGTAPRSPSFDIFYRERAVHTCPSQHVGRLSDFTKAAQETSGAHITSAPLPGTPPRPLPCVVGTPCAMQTPMMEDYRQRIEELAQSARGPASCHSSGAINLEYLLSPGALQTPLQTPTSLRQRLLPHLMRTGPAFEVPYGFADGTLPHLMSTERLREAPYGYADARQAYAHSPLVHSAGCVGGSYLPVAQPSVVGQSGVANKPVLSLSAALNEVVFGQPRAAPTHMMGMSTSQTSFVAGFAKAPTHSLSLAAHGAQSIAALLSETLRQPAVAVSTVEAPPAATPLQAEEPPSVGSWAHATRRCRPCAFLHTKGCENGRACGFCHLCGADERKRRRKEKAEVRVAVRRAKKEVPAGRGIIRV
eukprot:CAMPEP_0203971444 /NCGR_PEP_ID=MMETSP0359-20131031/98479_1 /ASSEMBLY_ACC=CAM_ASM_000338 /TAXON_ID=268821 /ORGANISM="Scrippsiella Hangoei, Strain SHTV-5" /LENGTH=438 /DNA_ID=CAMNT_0050909419 /DNA_START=75 /DNA_END=1391 /DNA_ORIENTATION=-